MVNVGSSFLEKRQTTQRMEKANNNPTQFEKTCYLLSNQENIPFLVIEFEEVLV